MCVESMSRQSQEPRPDNGRIISEILASNQVRVLIPHDPEIARYNAAVIRSKKSPNDLLILVREVPIANVKAGTPDRGDLLIYRSTPDKIEKVAELDLSDQNVGNWEDARAFMSEVVVDDQGIEREEVLVGLTAIRAQDNKPVAATVRGRVVDGNFSIEDGSLSVYFNDEGKNVTPISLKSFLFRREGVHHSLELVEHGQDENGQDKLDVKKIVDFPIRPWCEWQIGTQAQILPGGILPIHGVSRLSLGLDAKTKEEVFGYSYSLGLAQLDENFDVTKISDAPLFTRESFKNILPMGKELDPNKDVIYCCGYSVEGDVVRFIVNIGDLMTVEVSKSMFELRKILEQSSSAVPSEMPVKTAA